jgi:hypothetical protein
MESPKRKQTCPDCRTQFDQEFECNCKEKKERKNEKPYQEQKV